MGDRTEYMREYKRRQREEDPERARVESRKAYERLKAREAADPELRARREAKAREWVSANRERLVEQARKRYDRIRVNPEALMACRKKAREYMGTYRGKPEHWEKDRARWVAGKAKKSGRLSPEPCKCGSDDVEMHHPDYSKPLEVRWLCKKCHEAEHRTRRKTAKSGT